VLDVDVNFGFDDHSVLRAKKLRGKLARKLDLAMTKVRLLETYGAQDRAKAKLKRAEARVRRLIVLFKEQCKILETAPPRRVRTAFITFGTRRQRDACLKLYQDRGSFLTPIVQRSGFLFCGPNKLKFKPVDSDLKQAKKGGFVVRMTEASEPENLIWENLGLSWPEKMFRLFVSTVFTIALLVCGTALVILAMNEQAAVAAEFPATDCTPYIVEPFNNLNWTLLELLDRPNSRGYSSGGDSGGGDNSTTTTERWGQAYSYEPGSWGDVLTPQAIIEDQRPGLFNLTEGSSGVLSCFCTSLADYSAVGCGKGADHREDCGPFKMRT
jgi:hypothetical protein